MFLKFTVTLSALLASCSFIFAQTNSFPSSGNVGIGTPNPSAKLEVVGKNVSFLSNSSSNQLRFGRKLNELFQMEVDDYNGRLDYIQDVDRNEPHIFYIRNRSAGTNEHNDIRFQTAGTDRLSIKRNGNIGIGTTSPTSRLTVNGDIHTQGLKSRDMFLNTGAEPKLRFREENSGQDAAIRLRTSGLSIDVERVQSALFIQKFGNVGIGTTDPTAKLTVAGDIKAQLLTSKDIYATTLESDDLFIKSSDEPKLRFREENSGQDAAIRVGVPGLSIDVERVQNALFIQKHGNVGIGTTSPTAKLTVAGGIHAQEVKVTTNAGADFVFEDGYALRPLAELDAFVKENKHLPEIAPAARMVAEGVDMGEFQIQLLQKVEELTLYVIGLQKEVEKLKGKNERLKASLSKDKKIETLILE